MTKFKRKKTNTRKADAILAADLHIRPDVPIGRTDDYFAAMEKKIDFTLDLSKQNDCPLFVAGDLGHKSLNNGWPTWLLKWAISKFKEHDIICIVGQHDLPNHQICQFNKSGMGVLNAAGVIQTIGITLHTSDIPIFPNEILIDTPLDNKLCACHFTPTYPLNKYGLHITPFPYGSPIKSLGWGKEYEKPNIPMIAMTHQSVLHGKSMFDGIQGLELLKDFPEYQLILSGDNHLPFTEEYQGRRLVNPGSMMRNTADQKDHKPRVYLWWADTNEIQAVYLPIEKDVISREHIKDTTERDNRFDALICRVRSDVEIEMSYSDNVDKYFNKYRTEKAVKDKVLIHVV